ncbi:MAG TPA: ABC transporter permease subunit [Dehalococcoidia bacterium]|nr:ABC transporter permease subunit [Dehalococcoidia bacterium]
MTVAAPAAPTTRTGPGLGSQVRAEWTKISSARALYIQLALAVIVGIGISALICVAVASSWDNLSPGQQIDLHPITTSLGGVPFADIVLIVTGVTLVSSEYTSGMIRLTMTVTPNRLRVLFAKLVVIAAVTWAISLVIVLGSFVAGQAILATHAGVPTASLADSDVQRAILVAWLSAPLFPLIGAALGAILRSTASAITTTLGLIFVPGIVGNLLPMWWQDHIITYFPSNARSALLDTETNLSAHLSAPAAAITLVLWIVASFAIASVLLRQRDV